MEGVPRGGAGAAKRSQAATTGGKPRWAALRIKNTSPPAEESEAGSRDHGRGPTNVVADGLTPRPDCRDRLLKAVSPATRVALSVVCVLAVDLVSWLLDRAWRCAGEWSGVHARYRPASCLRSARSIGGRSLAPPSFPDRSTASAAAARNSSAAQSKYPRQIVRLSVRAARRFPGSCEQRDQGASGLI